jgi:hypothetical protein
MTQRHNGNIGMCPTCEGAVQLSGNLHIGQKLSCRRCGSTLAVLNRRPLELVLAKKTRPDDGRAKAYKDLKKNMASRQHTKNPVPKRARSNWAFLDDDDDEN